MEIRVEDMMILAWFSRLLRDRRWRAELRRLLAQAELTEIQF